MAKITGAEFDALSAAVKAFDTDDCRARYRVRDIPRGHLVTDIDKRYRWDLFYAAHGWDIVSVEYDHAHIDTALRKIVSAL